MAGVDGAETKAEFGAVSDFHRSDSADIGAAAGSDPTCTVSGGDDQPSPEVCHWLVHHPHKRPADVLSTTPAIHRTTSTAIRRRSLGVCHTYRALRQRMRIACPIHGLDQPSDRSHAT